MENKAKKSRRSIIRNALLKIFKDGVVETADIFGLIFETKYKGFQMLKKGEFRRIVWDLIKSEEIQKVGKNKFKISNIGVVKAISEINKTLVKDGQIRILVFDIPETKRSLRSRFRNHIRHLGFKKHQQSVWVSEYDSENWMLKIIDYHQVGDYVSLYIGKHIW